MVLKHFDFKKDVDLDAHVKVFNYAIKENVETSKKYMINVFNYMLKDMTLDWCHNYMSIFPNCIFLELIHAFYKHHRKI
jgi:hypothetical protein